MKVGAEVGAILQDSGTFANPTTGTNNTTSTDVADMIDGSTGTNTTIFVADDDYILIGAAAAFTEIEFIIETPANNPGIKPTFGYSTTGNHQFTTFSPIDGTNGFRNTGVIAWDAVDLTGHTTNGDTGTFDIKIIRTHSVAGSVSLFYAKTAATVVYSWNKDGDVSINTLSIATSDTSFVAAGTTTNTGLFIESPDQFAFHGFTLRKISDAAGRFTVVDILKARVGPAAVVDGDGIGAMQFFAHDGTDYNRSVGIQAEIDGTVASNTVPGALIFETTLTNSLTERMRISSGGRVAIGNIATPLARLHVDQFGGSSNIPVLILDQADVSEEMIEFVSTIGTGNAIEAVGAKTLTPTHFIKVTIPGGLTRYIEVGTIA